MEYEYKEVDFETHCKMCKYKDLDEKFDPCCECLEQGMNIGTSKPINWKEKD